MPLSFEKRLQSLVDEHKLDGHLQCEIGRMYSKSGEAQLFEFYGKDDAKIILQRLDTLGVEKVVAQIRERWNEQPEPEEESEGQSPQPPSPRGSDGVASMQQLNQVLDEETGKIVAVSDDMRRIAHSVQQRIEGATIITAFLIQLVRDEKLYLAFGCGSFKEYADTMLPFTRRTAYRYISISEKFAPLFPKLDSESVKAPSQIVESIASDEAIRELSSLGTEKLYELTKIPDADFEEVLSKGVVKMPDGEEWALEDIKAETARKITEEVRKAKKEYQQRLSRLEEDKKKYREERDHFREELEKNAERIERSTELEQKYGSQAARMEEIDHLLGKTEKGLRVIEDHFGKVDVDHSDPESLKERVMSLIRRQTLVLEAARMRYGWLEDMDELSLFPAWKLKEQEAAGGGGRQGGAGDTRLIPGHPDFDPDATIDEPKRIRTDTTRMAIKFQSAEGKYSHGWANLENGFKTVEEMEARYQELLASDEYVEG